MRDLKLCGAWDYDKIIAQTDRVLNLIWNILIRREKSGWEIEEKSTHNTCIYYSCASSAKERIAVFVGFYACTEKKWAWKERLDYS